MSNDFGDEPSPDDQRLASYAPPPPGDKAWLDVPDDLLWRLATSNRRSGGGSQP